MSKVHFKGHLAVVTGAASGIGKGIAERCCEEGIHLALVDVNEQGLHSLQTQLTSKHPTLQIESFVCDCSDYNAICELVESIKLKFKRNCIEMLFNNVGVASLTPVINGNLAQLRKTMDINVWSVIYLTHLFLPLLKASNNKNDCFIVNTGSVSSIQTSDSFYGITKHAVLAISETLDRELHFYFRNLQKSGQKQIRRNIFVCCLCPGFIFSNLMESSKKQMKQANTEIDTSGLKTGTGANPGGQMFEKWGKTPTYCANVLFEGLKDKKFIVYTHPEWMDAVIDDRTESLKSQTPNRFRRLAKVMKYGSKL